LRVFGECRGWRRATEVNGPARLVAQNARFFAGSGFKLGSRTQVILGFKAVGEISSSGSTLILFYGPAFSIEYNFRRDHALNENHLRTTAFKDFDF
jgi:hypothetical protein